MVDRKKAGDLLNKINKKSKKKWTLQDMKKMTQGYSSVDVYDDKRMEELIKKVANAAGVKMNEQKLDQVKKQVLNKVSQMKK